MLKKLTSYLDSLERWSRARRYRAIKRANAQRFRGVEITKIGLPYDIQPKDIPVLDAYPRT